MSASIRRIVYEHDYCERIRTSAATGSPAGARGAFTSRSGSFLRRQPQRRLQVGEGGEEGREGTAREAGARTTRQALEATRTTSTALVSQTSDGLRVSQRMVDSTSCGRSDSPDVEGQVPSALPQSMAERAMRHIAEAGSTATRTQRSNDPTLDPLQLSAHSKRARELRAHLVLIDESGMLLAPLVRRTLAPRGQTPIIKQKGSNREKISLMAAICLSPRKGRLSLHYRTYPKKYINNELAAEFLRDLLRHLRGHVIVIWDGGAMHKGPPIRELLRRFPRLELRALPPYAPELNPVEHLWNHLKYHQFVNYVPPDLDTLHREVKRHLDRICRDPARLRSFLNASKLPFY